MTVEQQQRIYGRSYRMIVMIRIYKSRLYVGRRGAIVRNIEKAFAKDRRGEFDRSEPYGA